MIEWLTKNPELGLFVAALVANGLVEALQLLGAPRAASVIAAMIPHARGIVGALAASKRQPADHAGSESRPLALDADPPAGTNDKGAR